METSSGITAPAPSIQDASRAKLRLSPGPALWLTGAILVAFLAAASAPSPLYTIYRDAWGFSAFTLTIVFSSYALAMLAALLVFGALSNHRGRREVLLVSLVVELASLALFLAADSVGWLLAARIVQGLATGIASSALGAGLLDLHRDRGALVNAVAPMVGLGLGALGTSILVQFAPAPTSLVFDLFVLLFVLLAVMAYFLPETVIRRPGAWASMRPTFIVPTRARRTMWQVLPLNTAQWSLGGFYMSLGPTLARIATGNPAPIVGGALIATLVLSSAITIALIHRRPPRPALRQGAAGLAIGVAIMLCGVVWHSTLPLFAGTVIAGFGFGAGFNGSIRSLVPLAAPHERADMMSSFFALSYLAFSIPAIVAGLFAAYFELETIAIAFGLALILMAGGAWAAMRLMPGPSSATS